MNKIIPIVLVIIVLGALAGLLVLSPVPDNSQETSDLNWRDIQLKDVSTGNGFKISDFKGKPVLLESFAVWCPTCTQQQKEIKALHEKVGDDIISVSIDTDPNEDENRVLDHINRNDFTWIYAVDDNGFSQSLVDEFGINVVNAPSAPVVLICENHDEARLLRFGVKDAGELLEEVNKGC